MNKITDFFKLLSDETRLRIMVLLLHGEFCVCQLTGITGLPQPNVSKHLAKLRDMGFVKDERKEQYIFYSLTIQDPIFSSILETIVLNLTDYPVLVSDGEKSQSAAKYIEMAGNCQ